MNIEEMETYYPVIIAGGGPVGLYLGCCLHQRNLPFLILEKRMERIKHSRSLGIHPVSLELFDELGIADQFVDRGIKIKKGLAFSDKGQIGSISFESCPEPYNFILSLPQYITEEILENHLRSMNPNALIRGAEVINIYEQEDRVLIEVTKSGQTHTFECRCLVGCDGKESPVRDQAGIPFEGSSYPDTYIMGDYDDNTGFGSDAAIFLTNSGLIESFPLENKRRRWVVKTKNYIEEVNREDLEKRIASRIGHDLNGKKNHMLSSFGVQKLVANPIARKRIALAGDAAHIVSPIGGQGMNLGWLDAADLAESLIQTVKKPDSTLLYKELEEYAERRLKVSRQVIKRAEWNMKLGRKPKFPALRNAIVWLMLKTPLQKLMARLFTMRYLEKSLP